EKIKHFHAIMNAKIPHKTSCRGFAQATKRNEKQELEHIKKNKNGEAVNTKVAEKI
ncbi:hypothetical protein Ddye_021766, partial [Dipteronia dyeriana]